LAATYAPVRPELFWLALAALGLCGALGAALLPALARALDRAVSGVRVRRVSGATLAALLALVFALTGPAGVLVLGVSSAIGCIPVLWGARRMNAMGVLLVPMLVNVAGLGALVAGWLGLG
jgi:putative membrane protein